MQIEERSFLSDIAHDYAWDKGRFLKRFAYFYYKGRFLQWEETMKGFLSALPQPQKVTVATAEPIWNQCWISAWLGYCFPGLHKFYHTVMLSLFGMNVSDTNKEMHSFPYLEWLTRPVFHCLLSTSLYSFQYKRSVSALPLCKSLGSLQSSVGEQRRAAPGCTDSY